MKKIISLVIVFTLMCSATFATNGNTINNSIAEKSDIKMDTPAIGYIEIEKDYSSILGVIQFGGYTLAVAKALQGDYRGAISIAGISVMLGFVNMIDFD